MNLLNIRNKSLILERFPRVHSKSPLQAWDAADEHLLSQSLPGPDKGPLVIFNDSFGALACALSERGVFSVSDSFTAQQATRDNLAANHCPASNVILLDSLAMLPATAGCVLIKLPKSLAMLEYQLRAIRGIVTAETVIIAAAKAKDIHASVLQLFAQILGPANASLAWRKTRLIHCQYTAPALSPKPDTICWPLEGTDYQIHNHASVFSRHSLDIGARLFLKHLPVNLAGEIVDLGCGNGVIGLKALEQNPHAQVDFIDESWMAVASSQLNVTLNRPADLSRSTFSVNHALQGRGENQLQAVLCNPPFHQQHTITDHIAWQMFCDARRCLQKGGELRVIGNRHLNYYQQLKKLFGHCSTLAADPRFVVLRAVK